MDRYTQAMVTKKAQTFARLMGREYGEKPGNYWLDHTASYGGYTLVEVTDCNGQRNPFGSKRRRAEAMYDTLDFACEAIRLEQERADEGVWLSVEEAAAVYVKLCSPCSNDTDSTVDGVHKLSMAAREAKKASQPA